MKTAYYKKLVCWLLAAALLVCALPFCVLADKGFRGSITNVNLTVEREPYIASDGSSNKIQFSAEIADESTRYEVGPSNTQYSSDFKNGVAWYDVTEESYVTDPNYTYRLDGYDYVNFILTQVYRVEIVVRITGNEIHESSWFKAYGEGEDWNSAVAATVNGHEATVSPYRDYDLGMYLLVSYTFEPCVPDNPYSIWIIEGQIDAPRGGRVASFDATAGGYQGYYRVKVEENSTNRHHGVTWYDNTVGKYVKEGDKFITGHDYTVTILMSVDNPFYQNFHPHVKRLNGYTSEYVSGDSNHDCTVKYTYEDIKEALEDYVSFQVYSACGPIAGMTPAMLPQMTVTCDENPGSNCELIPDVSKYYYNNVCWINSSTYQPLGVDEPFEKGERYTLIVPIRATGDNRFSVKHTEDGDVSDMWTEFIPEIGDSVISTRCISPNQSKYHIDREIHTYIDFPACEEGIFSIKFNSQTPKEGEQINTNVTSGASSKYRTKNVTWFDDTTEHIMAAGEKFVANHNYSLIFEAYAANGCIFPFGTDKYSIEGETVDVNGREGVISYKGTYTGTDAPWRSFMVTCDMGLCNDSVIEELAFKVAAPVAGQTPSYDVLNLGSGYHTTDWEGKTEEYWHNPVTYAYYGRNGVQWWDNDSNSEHMYEDETFIEGHSYTVVILADADNGYEFYHDKWYNILATATVNGEQAELRNTSSDDIYHQRITYTFVCGEAQGYTVSGTAKSSADPETPTVVRLTKAGYSEPDFEAEIYGTSINYSFNSVQNGTYTLCVTKSGYTPVNRVVTVNGNTAVEDIILKKPNSEQTHTPGDINGDGKVNNKDLTRLFQYLSDWDVEIF